MKKCNSAIPRRQRSITQQAGDMDANCFFNLLTSPQLLESVEMQLPEHRERTYPPTVTLAMFLGQVMSSDRSCQNAVNQSNVSRLLSGLSVNGASTGGYCLARQRLPLEMVKSLTRQTSELISSVTPRKWLWRGRHVKQVDGSTILMPDSEDNQTHYPQHGQQSDGVGFPLARLVAVISLSTGVVHDVAMGPYKGKGSGEHGLFRELMDTFTEGDIMLADGYYCSYFLIARLQARGVDVLFEQHGARQTDFRRGQKLGTRDHIVRWSKPIKPSWMSPEDYQACPDKIQVREVRVGKKVLVSTFLKRRSVSKKALGELYLQRWHVELDLRNIKTTLGMEMLTCKTAEMCQKEMWVYLLAYNLIRLLMAQAASQAGLLPRQLSFKHTLQIWLAWSSQQFATTSNEDTKTLFILIAEIKVGNRPARIEPRAVKRRPKPYPRLQNPREVERRRIIASGHGKKLGLN